MKKLCLLFAALSSSSAFATLSVNVTNVPENSLIDSSFTCDADNSQPPITWTNAPANTQSFAMIMTDPDVKNGPFYHWVLYNIPATDKELKKDSNEGTVGVNSFGTMDYKGPCPPDGQTHHYIFTLYALDTKLNLTPPAKYDAVMKAFDSHIIEKAQYTITYKRR